MDTETMVKELMKAQRAPLNKLLQKKQLEEWKRDSYREMNTLLLNFRNITADLRLQGTFLKKTVTSENDLAVSAKFISTPQQSAYTVKVNKLATAGSPSSVKFTNNMADATAQFGGATSFSIYVGEGANQKEIQVGATDSINSVVQKINAVSATTGVTVAYSSGDKSLVFTSATAGSASKVAVTATAGNPLGISNYSKSSGSISLPVDLTTNQTLVFGSETITLNTGIVYDGSGPGKNLSDLAKAIQTQIDNNANLRAAGLKVNAYGDKLTFTADQTLTLQGTGTLNSAINLTSGDLIQAPIQNGSDGEAGEVVINGTTMSMTSNTFTYDGVEYTAKQVTATAVNVNVKPDEDAIFDKIKNFVDEYNKLIETLNKKIDEPKYRDYKPLLEEEREAMSEKQIELWEEKAKSGILNRDPYLGKILTDMRLSLYTKVTSPGIDSKFDTISEIGITVGPPDSTGLSYMEKGKLYIDEGKLRAAIRENGTKVMELFTKSPTSTTEPDKFNETGIAKRLYDQLDDVMEQITDVAGSAGMSETSEYFQMGKTMRSLNKDINRWEERLQEIEDRYWRQFTAMEKAISQANSQSAWLAQQLGGGA